MKPMLACDAPAELSSLPYPVLSSEKIDGIRCVIKGGVAYSRTLKPIRNRHIQKILGRDEFNGLDGELVVGEPNASDCMRVTNSGVMSIEGNPTFTYYVFDIWNRPGIKYDETLIHLKHRTRDIHMKILPQRWCHSRADVEDHEREALDAGYEGLIVRRPDGAYKYGRSTLREGYLMKVKRYLQEEATVVGYMPYYHNDNDAEINAIGYTQRSSAQGGKVELPLLGALIVQGKFQEFSNVQFSIGTGFTLGEREYLWNNRESQIGRVVTYKFFPTGSKDRPRHPIFVSFRDLDDL